MASFPAEDHFFTAVNLNGTWYAVDTGYYGHAIPLSKRVIERAEELGNVSYIVIYLDGGSFLELTQRYVPYDTIIIRVTYRGIPVVSACISLKHKFRGGNFSIPGDKHYFYTDDNGIVVLHLGLPKYKREKVSHYDPYFLIYVNDKCTYHKVTSSGSHKTWHIHIELTELDESH